MGSHKNVFYTPIGDGSRAVNLDLLHRHVGPADADGCCPWQGMKNNIGYPFIGFKPLNEVDRKKPGRMMLATRALLMSTLGRSIRPGHNANHTCHNRWCMNVDHLEEGTQSEKISQMVKDCRPRNVKGGARHTYKYYKPRKQNRLYKYTEEQIQYCRVHEVKNIQQQWGWEYDKAIRAQRGSRNMYKWLPWPES